VEFDELEAMLRETFEDQILSQEERHAVMDVLEGFAQDEDSLRYVRNRAFGLVREQLAEPTQRRVLEWLERIVKVVDVVREDALPTHSAAYFCPGNDCLRRVTDLIRTSQRSIDVCVFTITDSRITRALLSALERGVTLRVITDDEKAKDKGSGIRRLVRAGIEVLTDASPDHMHHKFAIFDDEILVNGSFNWTRSASERNYENIIVSQNRHLVQVFKEQFEALRETFAANATSPNPEPG
jgi:cardiolipin hydrolase